MTPEKPMLHFLFSLVIAWPLALQGRSDAPVDQLVHAVSYVEVAASSSATAAAAFKQYREASRQQPGFVRVEAFEQIGRPGHFVMVETWRDRQAFDGRAATEQPLLDKLKSIRLSDYDQRPYKTLAIGATAMPPTSRNAIVISHVDVTPDQRVPPLLMRLAEASRKEDGNLRFDVVQHTMRANHFTVVEIWRDQKALDAHVAAAHTKQYRTDVQPMTGSPLDERVYKVVE
jgi:quinol monooxygenase YgiN